jgi:hypothetical protein
MQHAVPKAVRAEAYALVDFCRQRDTEIAAALPPWRALQVALRFSLRLGTWPSRGALQLFVGQLAATIVSFWRLNR